MEKRYPSFKTLLGGQPRDNTAFEYFEENQKKNITYGEFLTLVENYPTPEESTIGIFCDNSLEAVTAIFALAGKKRLVLLSPYDSAKTLNAQIAATRVSKLIGRCEEGIVFPAKDDKNNADEILFFTSGTTSSAKAVMLDEKRLCSSAFNGGYLLPLSKNDKLLSVLPHSHVFGFVCSLLWPLSFGACVCLGRGLKSIFFDFNEYKPSVTSLVPEMAGFLAAKGLFNKELKLILIGAGDCPNEVLSLIKSMGIKVSFGYGLTETSSGIALSLGDNPREMTICPDYKVNIAADGEIVVKSDTTLMRGYFEDRKSTDKVLNGNTLYTGDLGKIKDGKLFITGRKKEMLVLPDGTKVFLPEYEEHLRAFLGKDSDFAVVQNEKQLLCLYIAKPDNAENAVSKFNLENSRSHQISKIIYVNEIPRTATGKVERYKLVKEEKL